LSHKTADLTKTILQSKELINCYIGMSYYAANPNILANGKLCCGT